MREYTGPTAATVASRLPGGTGRPDSAGRYRVRGFCHGHGDKRDRTSLSIQDRDQGGLLVTCFVGCDRQTIIAALERATGLTIWQAWTPTGATQGRFSRLAGVGGIRTPKTTPAAAPDGGHGPDPDGPGGLAERRYCQGQRNRPSGLALAQRAESLEAGGSPAVVPPLAAGLGALAGQGAAHRRRFHRRPGGAPLPLRLFVESVLAVSQQDRRSGKPTDLNISLRELLSRLYPGQRTPRPTEYWPRIMQAVHALDSDEARIPILDPDTGRHEMRRIVSVGGIPRGAGHLDDNIRITVDLPRGSEHGPQVSQNLGKWGLKSAPGYRR